MKKIIKIYSPVDGIVKPLVELNDGVFSEEMLGIGFYIEPKSNVFFSPLAEGELIQIFNTKHAYYFKDSQGPAFLMHIGLDTVNLEGKPFDVKAQIGDKLSLKKEIVAVDFKMIEKHKMLKATPIVLDLNEFTGWKFEMQKDGEVKQGDLIGTFTHNDVQKEVSYTDDIKEILESKNHYQITAGKIFNLIGGESNYTNVYNCMTRLRFEIIDKNKVDQEAIKQLSIVKGVLWAGNQIQIVIGGEVYKVKDAVLEHVENLHKNPNEKSNARTFTKVSIPKKLMQAFAAIILPALPIMMTSGLLMGIKTILVMTGAIVDMKIGLGSPINMQVDAFSVFMNVAAETGLKLLGIYIGYNTIKWLGGPEIIQIFVSLMIAGATLGLGLVPNLSLFSIGNFSVKISFYSSSIIPHIVSAFILYYADKWIKTWMPTSIDVLFRPLLGVMFVFILIFFALGPILFLIEQGITKFMGLLSQIPYGIGVGLFAIVWQPLVLTGMHTSIIVPISIAVSQGIPSTLLAPTNIAVFTQVGAAIGVCILTKNKITKVACLAALPGGIVGVTEPILYGINLPKWRPFLAGLITAGIIGLFSGLLGVENRTTGGLGIFGFTALLMEPSKNSVNNVFIGAPNTPVMNCVFWLVTNLLAIPLAAFVCYLIYVDRINENKGVGKTTNLLIKVLALKNHQKLKDLNTKYANEIKNLKNIFSKEEIEKLKKIENQIVLITNKSVSLDKAQMHLEKQKEKLKHQIKKIELSKIIGKAKIEKQKPLIDKYNLIKNGELTHKLEKEIEKLQIDNATDMQWISKTLNTKFEYIENIIDKIFKENNSEDCNKIMNNYWNSLHSLELNYELVAKKINIITKKEIKKALKNA
ncbi:PTS glucose transporter subunit IIABC [Mesoplasma corruscae]|uniref:PTS system, beta-glucoside-specific IIABC component n=1 Tax=Mesoplasma corruscae TaxID=216874 RepID=A0A2S5REB6_9MOLU|nr:PTS glucose transporter subunit IIABC [Mesoplasma corruscae]PPE05650.1 PTS system, beta-glucoside-specific IIABC component [Mesoplasma corruscae]